MRGDGASIAVADQVFEQAKLREPAFARVGDVPVLEVGGDQLERAQVRVRVDDDLLWGCGGGDVGPWRPGFLCKVAGLENIYVAGAPRQSGRACHLDVSPPLSSSYDRPGGAPRLTSTIPRPTLRNVPVVLIPCA